MSARIEAALRELVALKDLKEWLGKPGSAHEQFHGRDFEAGEAVAEYHRRKPLAWDESRAALADEAQPVQAPVGEERRALIEADAWMKFAAASERIGQKLFLSERDALDLRNAIDKLSSILMRDTPPQPVREPALQWAVDNWNAEVRDRPVVNVHRQFLDSAWRKMMRHFGGDPDALVGPPLAPLIGPRIPGQPRKPLTDEQIDAIPFDGFTHPSVRPWSEAECLRHFARAAIAEFCRINGIGGQP